jgi:hypothetical protein
MPKEIAMNVCSFLHRDWWFDKRKECWCWDCVSKEMSKRFQAKRSRRMGDTSGQVDGGRLLEYCPECGVAMYCSYKHRTYHYREGHKKVCGIPPFRKFGNQEAALFAEVFGRNQETSTFDDDGNEGAAYDEDSSWEIIDNDEDLESGAPVSRTRIIQRFLDAAAQNIQG